MKKVKSTTSLTLLSNFLVINVNQKITLANETYTKKPKISFMDFDKT